MVEKKQLAIKSEKHILDLDKLLIMEPILTLLMNDMKQKIAFSMVIFIKSILLTLTKLIEVNMVMDMIFKHEIIENRGTSFFETKLKFYQNVGYYYDEMIIRR